MKDFKLYGEIVLEVYKNNSENQYPEIINDPQPSEYLDLINNHLNNELKKIALRGISINFIDYFNSDNETLEKSIRSKVESANLSFKEIDNSIYSVMNCKINGELTTEEINALKENFIGDYSDGFGENFEQQEIKTEEESLYVKLFHKSDYYDFSLFTKDELQTVINNDLNL